MARTASTRLKLSRRSTLALAVVAVAAAALAVGLWLAFRDGAGSDGGRTAYLAQVSSTCRRYARQLARIGAPSDLTAYGEIVSIVDRVLPLLRRQAAAMQAVPSPQPLRRKLDRLFALDRRAIGALEGVARSARRRDLGGVASGLGRFSVTRDRSHALALVLGIRCETN
jgi:hypothetical protein